MRVGDPVSRKKKKNDSQKVLRKIQCNGDPVFGLRCDLTSCKTHGVAEQCNGNCRSIIFIGSATVLFRMRAGV